MDDEEKHWERYLWHLINYPAFCCLQSLCLFIIPQEKTTTLIFAQNHFVQNAIRWEFFTTLAVVDPV